MRFLSTLAASVIGTLIALGIIAFFGFLLITALVMTADRAPAVEDGSVLVMELTGNIPERAPDDPFSQAFSTRPTHDLRSVTEALEKAAADDRIEAILLRTHGLSVGWGTLEEIRNELMSFKESGKPVFAHTGEHSSSERDYYLNSTADSVFADPEGIFEYNGFVLQTLFFQNMLDEIGVEPHFVQSGPFKSAGEPFTREDLSPENRTQMEALLEDQNTIFMEAIAEARGRPAEEFQQIAEEEPFLSARNALDHGLLDALIYEDEVEGRLKAHLEMDEDDELNRVPLRNYVHVSASDAGLERGRDGEVAIVYAEGAIMPGRSDDSPFSQGQNIGSETFARAMEDARESDQTDAVVVRVNSPGGSGSASDAMWREIRQTADMKPVVISMGNQAASGGYWIATAADTIVADPLTITGSIGVFSLFFDTNELLEDKLGITVDQVETSPYADMLMGTTPPDEQELAVLERFVDQAYEQFLERVAEARGMSVEEVASLAEGRIWTGSAALENNLVDELGGLDHAITIAAEMAGLEEDSYYTRSLPRSRTIIEQMTGSFEARVADAWLKLRTTPGERAVVEQLTTLRHLHELRGTVQARLPMELVID